MFFQRTEAEVVDLTGADLLGIKQGIGAGLVRGNGGWLTPGALSVGTSEQFFGRQARPRLGARRAVEAAVFRTISSADWAAAIARARIEGNAVREKIRAAVARKGGGA